MFVVWRSRGLGQNREISVLKILQNNGVILRFECPLYVLSRICVCAMHGPLGPQSHEQIQQGRVYIDANVRIFKRESESLLVRTTSLSCYIF